MLFLLDDEGFLPEVSLFIIIFITEYNYYHNSYNYLYIIHDTHMKYTFKCNCACISNTKHFNFLFMHYNS